MLGHGVLAPSTIGTFLRSFSWGHARQLDAVAGEMLARAWAAGAGPDPDGEFTIDVDSRSRRPTGCKKRAAPVSATPRCGAITRCLHDGRRRRCGALPAAGRQHPHGRGAASFLAETFARVRGRWRYRAAEFARRLRVLLASSGRGLPEGERTVLDHGQAVKVVHAVISKIPEADWTPIPYFLDDGADVAECSYRAFGKGNRAWPAG